MVSMRKGPKPQQAIRRPKYLGFDTSNVDATCRIPLGMRDYGFLKVTNTSTPYIKKDSPIDSKSLLERLKYKEEKINAFGSSKSSSDGLDSVISNNDEKDEAKLGMSFEMKRKLFNTAEFTITKGKKTGDMYHPRVDYKLPKYSTTRDSQMHALLEMEEFCNAMNIKITKGFGH